MLRSTAVTLGLIGVVEVGLDPPEVRIAPTGSITITVRLHGHLTDQVTGLIQNSARVAIEFELRYFPRAGRKLRLVSHNSIVFHSLTGRYEVRRGEEVAWAGSLEEAAALLGSATVTLGRVGTGLAVIKARATLPTFTPMIEGHGLPLGVSSWREVQEFYDQLKSFYDLLFTFVIAVVTVLSMVAIFAIISVSFLERLRELGSLRAIGTTRAELLSLLLVEALATYLAGAAAALGLGLAAGTIINALGITFVPIGSNLAVPFYIDLETRYFLIPAIITLLMTTAAALVPVVRTARMSVAHVLRHE